MVTAPVGAAPLPLQATTAVMVAGMFCPKNSEAGLTLVTSIVGVWGLMPIVAVVVTPLDQVDWITQVVPLAPFTVTEPFEIVHGPDCTDRVAPVVAVGVKMEP
jgi:hypothetical protein